MPALTPAPAVAGPFRGGHAVAHGPLQTDVLPVSATNRYSAFPSPSTRYVPAGPVFVVTDSGAADPDGLIGVEVGEGVPVRVPAAAVPAVMATTASPARTSNPASNTGRGLFF